MLVKVDCRVCPFQYAECMKPDKDPCPVKPDAPELTEWIKQALKSHLCSFVGEDLKPKDWRRSIKWLESDDAVKAITSKLVSTAQSR